MVVNIYRLATFTSIQEYQDNFCAVMLDAFEKPLLDSNVFSHFPFSPSQLVRFPSFFRSRLKVYLAAKKEAAAKKDRSLFNNVLVSSVPEFAINTNKDQNDIAASYGTFGRSFQGV